MKRYIMILVCLITTLSAFGQHYIGIKGGAGFGDVRFYPHYETPIVGGLLNGGITWRYYTEEPRNLVDRYAGGVAAELEFIQRGFAREMFNQEDVEYKRIVNSVILPFMWQPHFFMMEKKILVFFNAGITLQYNVSSKEYITDLKTGEKTENNYDMILVRDNRWGYGLCGGFGLGYNVGRVTVSAEGRYYFGYSDILKRKTLYEDNVFMRSPLDNIMITFGVSYRLGKSVDVMSKQKSMKRAAQKELNDAKNELPDNMIAK